MSEDRNTEVTVDSPDAALALQMGRDRMPLRLTAEGRTLVLFQSPMYEAAYVQAHIEIGEFTAARHVHTRRPAVARNLNGGMCIEAGSGCWFLTGDEPKLISGWLDGFYEAK